MRIHPRITGSLCANSHPGSYTGQDAFNDMLPVIERNGNDLLDKSGNLPIFEGGVASSLMARDYKFARDIVEEEPMERKDRKYVLRRLTPLECCRLQGFPDWWVDAVDGSDSAQYKMWGNGIALPCAVDVMGRLVKELRKEKKP